MIIYLLNDHTALTVNDHKPTVTVEPACEGTLEIEGLKFQMKAQGTTTPQLNHLMGNVRATFTDTRGVKYIVKKPQMKDGFPYSSVDIVKEYVCMRVTLDHMERELEKLTKNLHTLQANDHRSALGFLTNNIKNTEN